MRLEVVFFFSELEWVFLKCKLKSIFLDEAAITKSGFQEGPL